jgi:carbamoyltransferase
MNILGISGFENAMTFKKAHWPGLDEREYRISQGHDAAAALVVDGTLVAAASEERFDRNKHSAHFPIHAIRYCLEQAGLRIQDIHEIAHSFDYSRVCKILSLDPVTAQLCKEVFLRDALLKLAGRDLPEFDGNKLTHVNHHLSHAASAFYTSGFENSLVAVVDGMGEIHSASIFTGCEGRLNKVHEVSAQDSIGILYSVITLHLGFDFNSDEYKIMGLAPYGNPERFRGFFKEAVQLCDDGSIRIPILHLNHRREEREFHTATRRFLDANLIRARNPEDEITPDHEDVAAALQECLDNVMLHICGHFGRQTGLRKLALAGGVALNCTANGRLIQSGLFDDVYIQPAAGDDGSALGAALHRASLVGEVRNERMPVPFYGPAHPIGSVLNQFDEIETVQYRSLEDACAQAARLIAEGRVIAWFRGRMEFGPRALGHRSILADPGHPQMRDRINAMVKMREAFRPFAPAVTIEQVDRWFEVDPGKEFPYMIATVDVRPQYRAQLPAITHVNGSARVQTVSGTDNPEFHALLKAVGKTTGREMALNTSFNVKGQPMVNTPREAIETFLRTGIEFLFLENTLVRRRVRQRGSAARDRVREFQPV